MDTERLRRQLSAAITKKLGVLRMPYLCRPTDPKINPPAEAMFLVALLLGDHDAALLIRDIFVIERQEAGDDGDAVPVLAAMGRSFARTCACRRRAERIMAGLRAVVGDGADEADQEALLPNVSLQRS